MVKNCKKYLGADFGCYSLKTIGYLHLDVLMITENNSGQTISHPKYTLLCLTDGSNVEGITELKCGTH